MSENLCPQCKTPNRITARFCAECGSPLLGGVEKSASGSGSSERSSPHDVTSALSRGMVLEGRYRIENELGRGGFGAVYHAWDTRLSKAVAVKENLDASAETQRQFAREATVLANLSHPNLPRVIDHFAVPEQGQYLVMDFVEGEDLFSLLERQAVISIKQAIEWMIQVTDALEYLHSQEPPVLHRDIKPSNIRITPKGKAMLVDFGLVKVSDPRLITTTGARAVTPGYAPPEQYGVGKTDTRTDFYALGATLYRLVTATEPLESVQRISGDRLTPPYQINPRISPQLSKVIERAMALVPGQRYQTAEELKGALRDSLVAQETLASEGQPQQVIDLHKVIVDVVSEPRAKPAVGAQSAPVSPVVPSSVPIPPIAVPSVSSPSAVASPAQKGRTLPKRAGLWIGIGAGLLVIIICGSILAALVVGGDHEPTPVGGVQTGATSTMEALSSFQASLTAEATAAISEEGQATATAAANAKAMAGPSATARAQATVAALFNESQWPVKYYDSFDTNQAGWDEVTSDENWKVLQLEIRDGLHHAKLDARDYDARLDIVDIPTGEDFSLSVRTHQVAGPPNASRGLIFRAQDGDNLYIFTISDDHSFGVWVLRKSQSTQLFYKEWTNYILPGKWNEIAVIAEEKKFQIYINGHLLGSTTNDWFTSGKAGLYFEVGTDRSAEFETDDFLLTAP